MSYKFYTFHWATFKGGYLVSHDKGTYHTLEGFPQIEPLKQQIRDQLNNQSAEILIQNILEINKAKYVLITGKPFEPLYPI